MKTWARVLGLLLVSFSLSLPGSSALAGEVWAKCWQCHKETGKSFVDEVITLTGQNKDYLMNQLYRFKTGEREERMLWVMNTIAASLTDEEIEKVAEYYSKLNPRTLFANPAPKTKDEKRLYAIGEAHAQVCLGCHADAEARPAKRKDWPYISGQNSEAILIQLSAFSRGKRVNPMMDFIKVPPFNDPEVQAGLAYYFSRQLPPVPEGWTPPTPRRTKARRLR